MQRKRQGMIKSIMQSREIPGRIRYLGAMEKWA